MMGAAISALGMVRRFYFPRCWSNVLPDETGLSPWLRLEAGHFVFNNKFTISLAAISVARHSRSLIYSHPGDPFSLAISGSTPS